MASAVEGKAIRITRGNLDNNHIPVTYVKELFPVDCFGGSSKSNLGNPVTVELDGVGGVQTDIDTDKNILRIRERDAIANFYKLGGARGGSRVFFERTGPRKFRATVIQ
jgi:hypothetical protein